MKHLAKFFLLAGIIAFAAACGNSKDDEKRIADLESRLAELEAGSPAPATTVAQPDQKPEGPLPSFEFEEVEHDFGTIQQGDVVEHVFKFTNNGEAPLIIQSAVGSCGCTVPTYTRAPIAPGESGELTVAFDSKGKANLQNKTVTITANTWPKKTMLRVKAMIDAPEGFVEGAQVQ
jgi:hypothetical protein